MKEVLSASAYFGVVLSLAAFFIGLLLKRKFKSSLINPLLIAIVLTIGVLLLLGLDYQSYYASAKYLSYLLTPTTVCLAIPLYEQAVLLKKNLAAILIGVLSGVAASLVSILVMALLLRMDHAQYVTLLPKSVTTAIGMPLAESMGGYPSIAAIVIILTGVAGNILAPGFLKWIRVRSPIARGIAIGTASHAIGTSKAIELGEIEGAMSGLALTVAGLMTVLAATFFQNLL